jgi:hypothetical protein
LNGRRRKLSAVFYLFWAKPVERATRRIQRQDARLKAAATKAKTAEVEFGMGAQKCDGKMRA